jgi:hypothetical protein
MKKIVVIMLLIVALSGCENYLYKPYNAYVFLGGSNVSEELADGFRDCITLYDETALVIQHGHDDETLGSWVRLYYDSYKVEHNLKEDIGVVEAMLREDYGVDMFFWFQGEQDTLTDSSHIYYEKRLGFIREELRDELPGVCYFSTVKTWMDGLDWEPAYHQDKIRECQQRLGYYDFDSKYYTKADGKHLTPEAAYQLGWDIAYKYAVIKGWL